MMKVLGIKKKTKTYNKFFLSKSHNISVKKAEKESKSNRMVILVYKDALSFSRMEYIKYTDVIRPCYKKVKTNYDDY